jgi:hypothetical protein
MAEPGMSLRTRNRKAKPKDEAHTLAFLYTYTLRSERSEGSSLNSLSWGDWSIAFRISRNSNRPTWLQLEEDKDQPLRSNCQPS